MARIIAPRRGPIDSDPKARQRSKPLIPRGYAEMEDGTMIDPAKEHEHRDEARRLAQLPRAEQRAIIAMHQADADNPKVPKRDRDFARDRAKALTRLLRLEKKKKK